MVAPGLTVMVQGDEDGNMWEQTLWKLNQQIREIEYRQIRHDRMRGEDWHDSELRDLRRERETAELELQVYDLSRARGILSKRERELLKSLELKLKLRGGSEQSHAILGKKSLHGPRLEELNEMLVEAAEKGDLENVKCNIIEGADIETNARELVTPLWCAVANKHKSIVEFLLEKGANVEVANIFNETVLHRAITTGQDDIIDLLIKYHADVNSKGYKGQTPLLHACIQKNTKIALLLLENGAKLGASDDQGNSELSHATRNGSLSLTKLLVEKGAELEKANATGMTPFLWAAFSGSVSVGLYLRKKGSVITAVDHDGFTALHWSSSCNQVPFMGVLLGEALEDLNFTAPEKAEIAELGPQLQSIAFDIDSISERGETPLHVAANRGNSEAVSMLLKHGANFNARDESRRTALHHSVQFGEPKNEITMGLFLLLPTITTIMSAKDADGETALQIAVRKGYNRLVEILLQEIRPQSRNIVLDDNSEAGSTLFSAAPKKNKKIVQLLVNHEMDVVVEEEDGCKWARIERLNTKQVDSICALLLENKECWEQQPDSKQKTIFWAARNSRLDLVRERSPESKDLNIILYWAAVGGGSEIVELLLKEYEDKIKNQRFAISNEDGCEAVMVAARNGNENVVKQLLKAFKEFGDVSVQADILEPKTENWTAVQWAIHYHTLHYHTLDASKVVKHLLMNGAIPEPPETTVAGNGSFVPAVEMARGLKGNPQFDEEIIAMLETPLRVAPQPLPVVMPKIDAQWLVEVCKSFKSRIIDFYTSEGGFFALDRNSVVEDTIYSEGPDTGMSRARKAWGIKSDLRFRWIHLPANNVSMSFYVYLLLSLFTY
jgi:ankyrin repeat protein